MGSGIKGLKQGGIRDHILRIRDHGLGIGISAVVHRIRDQTDSMIMIKITKKLGFWIFLIFCCFASRTAYYMLLALSSVLEFPAFDFIIVSVVSSVPWITSFVPWHT